MFALGFNSRLSPPTPDATAEQKAGLTRQALRSPNKQQIKNKR